MPPSTATDAAPALAGPTKGEQTRQTVLDAAIARFGQDGYRATSVADIARLADVGSTVPYAYFPNKEALFLAALDEDAGGVINECLPTILADETDQDWAESLIFTLVEAIDRHPLAQRVMAGLEPAVTSRMAELPALTDLRAAVTERLRTDQAAGLIRADIDPTSIGRGAVTIYISLLMSVIQFGPEGVGAYGPDVLAVFNAALGRSTPTR